MIETARWSILVVEDDEAVRSTVVEGLREAGLVVEAVDGADRIDGWRGDVIVTDTFANPYRTEAVVAYLRDLRSRYTSGVVVLSGHNGAAADAADLPADAVVMKPFDLDDLIGVVTGVARRKNPDGGPAEAVALNTDRSAKSATPVAKTASSSTNRPRSRGKR